MKKIASVLATLLCAFVAATSLSANNSKPFVVPELRQWTGKTGQLIPQDGASITVASQNLLDVAQAFAADYKTMFGKTLPVSVGKATKGSFHFSLKADKKLGAEGYSIEISDKVTVTAPETVGAFWATRTLLPIAAQSDNHALP
ncbi:MAG: glycoside hydrolase family 20 zincin-like fold domain-containing protein, partial [Paramuribaculum sp.]|nr:glycoside hydrolase family 20 zincin-like fold domain-containing protein [Paramuribaculum sp.]